MSSRNQKSLLDLRSLSQDQVLFLFEKAKSFSQESLAGSRESKRETAALIFFEASTRTRMSFETACARMGLHPLFLDAGGKTSLEKGETQEDTLLNIAALRPAVLVIRSGDGLDQEAMGRTIDVPIVNAGWGLRGHPTQALLDIFTLWKRGRNLEKEKILIIGDIRHSRVAASHFELAKSLNYEIALCGPKHFLPENSQFQVFSKMEEGLRWCTTAMALRVQNERHAEGSGSANKDYHSEFGLTKKRLDDLNKEIIVMHPGPINHGVEMTTEVVHDSRAVILEQVTNGIYIRQAVLQRALGEEF